MNKIIVYERPDFQGLSKEFTSDVRNLLHENFNNCISSLKVIGNPWVAYTESDFAGQLTVYEEGEYANVYYNDNFSSLELVKDDLDNPQITLYEKENYKGRRLEFTCETSVLYGNLNEIASYKVQRGAWVLYEHKERGGCIPVARAGRDVPKFDKRLSLLHPLRAGKPTIKAEVEWDKKKEKRDFVTIDSIAGVNYGSDEQTNTTQLHREYLGFITESFSFSSSTQIGFGTKFEITVHGDTSRKPYCISNTFSVEKGSSNTRNKTEKHTFYSPGSIPPRTKLIVNVERTEVEITVPVKLTITTGFQSKVEYGEYRCENKISFLTSSSMVKI